MWRNNKVLVIDDNESRRHDLKILLDFLSETTLVTASDCWQASVAEENRGEDYVAIFIGDIRDSHQAPAQLFKELRAWNDELAIVLIGDENQHLADDLEETYRFMAIATLSVPPTYNKLVDTLHRAQLYREAQSSSKRQPQRRAVHLFRSLVGTSREIQNVREMMSQVADKDVSVLITGESGTGKEVVARNLHYNSPRRDKPFVPVNCGAIPAELAESELFGHKKGAFTGAATDRAGHFEEANGGTIFLDEIGELPVSAQAKLLRVLQEREIVRVGESRTRPIDVEKVK